MATTKTYRVNGMSCGHCVASVTEELSAVAGVTDVTVDLASGQVDVSSERPLELATVAAAVREAGYELAEPEPPEATR